LQGKMTATTESPELVATIKKWVSEIGKYPHDKVNFEGRTKQSTRLLKLQCHCGFIARSSRGAFDKFGLPSHCGNEMQIAS
jgi:hypothetical protein